MFWSLKGVRDYRETAEINERVFRNILRDLKRNREDRPMGDYIPKDLETEASVQEIVHMYSEGDRHAIFTILHFLREGERASIVFEDKANMSGGGAELEYKVGEEDSVEFFRSNTTWRF